MTCEIRLCISSPKVPSFDLIGFFSSYIFSRSLTFAWVFVSWRYR